MASRKRFDPRAFVSLALLWDFVILATSGVVLYVMPHGRVAYWIGWSFLGLDKNAWETVHTMAGLLMVLVVPFHVLVYNWSFVKHYFYGRGRVLNLWKEIFSSLAMVLVLLVTGILYVFPSSTVMDFGEDVKNSWAKGVKAPPVPHAEDLSLEAFSGLMGMDLRKVEQTLRARGLRSFDPKAKIKDVARSMGTTPKKIFDWLEPLATRSRKSVTGGTYGGSRAQTGAARASSGTGTGPGASLGLYKSVGEYARTWGLDPEKVLDFLRKKGAKDLSSIRSAAWGLGMRPRELHEEILQNLKPSKARGEEGR